MLAQRRRRIGVVHQDCRFIDHLSVAENILLPVTVSGGNIERARSDMNDLLGWVGLNALADHRPPELSGGERQRIGFARLFYHAPPFAVLDEATSAINPDEEGSLYRAVIEQGTTVVSIAHRLELRNCHTLELKLLGDGEGGWELHERAGGKWALKTRSAE